MSITTEDRLTNIESAMVNIYNGVLNLATFEELDEVVTEIFNNGIDVLESRINAIEHTVNIVEDILYNAAGR